MPSIAEILQFKYPGKLQNGQIVVQNDGAGDYIKTWNMGSIAKPTNDQIQALVTDPEYISNLALYNRVNAADGYGTLSNQLDMIYKDLRDGTQLWQQFIGNIKDVKYPKNGTATTPPNVTAILTQKRNSPSSAFKEVAIVKSTGSQAIAGTAKMTVAMSSEVSDPNNAFNNNVYTAVTGGLYEVSAFCQLTNYAILGVVGNYTWSMWLTQTGSSTASTTIGSYTHGYLGAVPGSMQGTYMIYLAAGDTVSLQVSKTDATSLNVTFAYISVKKICEA